MDQSTRFWDKIAERYARQPIADEEAYQKKLDVTRGYFRPDMEVLEFGCGTGSTAISHAPYVKHILATDVSSKMIAIAQDKARADNISNATFRQSSIDELDLPSQSLDAVLGLSILHLLESRDEAIASVYEMLKPGGVFVTSTVCLGDSAMRYLKFIVPIGRFLNLMPMVKVFTEAELAASLTKLGFDIDYQWRPDKSIAVFIVARKPE